MQSRKVRSGISKPESFEASKFPSFEYADFRDFKIPKLRRFEPLQFRSFQISNFPNTEASHPILKPRSFEHSQCRGSEIRRHIRNAEISMLQILEASKLRSLDAWSVSLKFQPSHSSILEFSKLRSSEILELRNFSGSKLRNFIFHVSKI